MDIPNQRSLHQQPTPRGGGLAFIITFYSALFFLFLHGMVSKLFFMALLGGIPIAIIGYCDDVVQVRNFVRILVHILAAFWGIGCLGWIHFLNLGVMQAHSTLIFSFFALGFTVWMINLYNFMDGIDGLAASQAMFVAAAGGVIAWSLGSVELGGVCGLLFLSVLGFLLWNWPPAKIFMGDVGSGFLGYILSVVMWFGNSQTHVPVPVWWILSAVFICDATFTLIKRMRRGEKWYSAHCEHAYQRIVQIGFRHLQVTLGVMVVNVFIFLPLAYFYLGLPTSFIETSYIVTIVTVTWIAWRMIVRRFSTVS